MADSSGPNIQRKFSVMSETAMNSLDNIEMSLDRFTKAMLTIDEQFNTMEDGASVPPYSVYDVMCSD